MWSRAVWLEPQGEEEGVIPSLWIQDDTVFWPPGVDATKAMANQKEPTFKWRRFKLVKVKITSGEYSINGL